MDARLVANYFILLRERTGFTNEVWAEKANGSVSTLKNLLSGKTEDPRLATIAPYIFAAGGSIDEMFTGKSKDIVKVESINSIKEIYEQQLEEITKINEAHINNIRAHYEQHRQDYKENVEKRLAEKDEYIKSLKKDGFIKTLFLGATLAILITLLIAEVMNPNLGWFRY